MTTLQQSIYTLERWGFFEVLLPFVLIFAIIFAVLEKVNIFSNHKSDTDKTKVAISSARKINMIISLSIGLIAVYQHMQFRGSRFDVISIINESLPQVALLIVVVLLVMIMLGLMGPINEGKPDTVLSVAKYLVLGVIIYIFGSNAGLSYYDLPYWLVRNDFWALILVIAIFGGVIYFIMGPSENNNPPGGQTNQATQNSGQTPP